MKLFVAGTGMRGSGYPNAENTLRILRELGGWQVIDKAHWLPESEALWKSTRRGWTGVAWPMAKLFLCGMLSSIRLIFFRRARQDWVYAPYPAIFLLWWLSWIPRGLRPRVVADAYISLWDAAFRDRGLAATGALVPRVAKWFEARALRAASLVFVDTVANKAWMLSEFRLDPERVHAVPLAIDDRWFDATGTGACRVGQGPMRVVYVGTFVPLHGVNVVISAVDALAGDPRFRFHFVGDGQQAGLLRQLTLQEHGTVTWCQSWMQMEEVAELLSTADLSFGVFGGEGKASRVLPFKVYLSLAAGTPVLTQGHYSLPEGVPQPPIFTVSPEPAHLVQMLTELAGDRPRLDVASRESREYFQAHLGPRAVLNAWTCWLCVGRSGSTVAQG